jgi:uncharacterized membrane protein
VYLLFLFIPKIDPFRKNIVSFGRQLEIFKLVIVVFFLVIYGIIILQYWGLKFNIVYVLMPVMAAFFYYIGHIMKHVKRNYFIGIRTPWTLADDTVWEKTHNIGSITFKINAVILVFGLINPVLMFWIFIGSLAVNVVFLYAYSYYIWKKLKKQAK